MSTNFKLGLLHFVHMLINVDGHIDDREMAAIQAIKKEENIDDDLFQEFSKSILTSKEHQIHERGVELLNKCSEEERLCAFVHLFRIAEADATVNMKEVRLLMYSIKATKIEFDDVVMSARMSNQNPTHQAQ
jgi:uncharacterized tellurite resistance protein B-like protein